MNNTLFRLGTENGWCTRRELMGWGLPLSVTPFYPTTNADAQGGLVIILNAAPDAVLVALWSLCQVKLGKLNKVTYPGRPVFVRPKGVNRVVVGLEHGIFEVRVKTKETTKGAQMDLIAEHVE